MKTALACLILLISFTATTAQNITVDVRYRVAPLDSTIPPRPFFIGRLDKNFGYYDTKALLELTAMRIWQKTNDGDSVAAYNPVMELYPGFSSGMYVVECENIPAADFSNEDAGYANTWSGKHMHPYFKLKKGNAVANGMSVGNDKRIIYAVDTFLTADKTGKKFTTVLQNRYLTPQQVSPFFIERWNFDIVNGKMEKNTMYYGYYLPKETASGDFVGYAPALCIQNPEPAKGNANAVLMKKNVVCDVAVNWPMQMLRNDSNLQRYAGVDAGNYLSIPDGNIPEAERAKMLAGILYFAMHHPANVFPVSATGIDTLHPFVSAEQVKSKFSKPDSSVYYDPYMGQDVIIPFVNNRSLDDIYAVRFYEDWYYDKYELTLKKVVRGVGFIMVNTGNMGNVLLEDAGIYIRVN